MKIALNVKLVKFAKLFKGSRLYAVGGFVRNSLLGAACTDIDLAGSLKIEEIKKLVEGTEFVCEEKSKLLGTALIKCENFVWEYSTFRKEIYENGGAHSPVKVEFCDSVQEDSKRRDFTMNSVYLDILKGELLDFNNGIYDIKKRIVKAIGDPAEVFSHDGVRILRMIRQSSELGFKIDGKTFIAANMFGANLDEISGERKKCELLQILNSPEKYEGFSKKKSHIYGLNLISSLRLWKYFYLPIEKVKFKIVKKAEPENRFIAFCVDVFNEAKPRDRELFLNNFLGGDGLKFPSAFTVKSTNIILGYIDALNYLNNKDYFFNYFNNFEIIREIIKKNNKKVFKKYNFFYKYLLNNKVAIQIKDLSIKGSDIKNKYPKIPAKRFGFILNELLSKVFDGEISNEKNKLLKEVEKYDY
ncbi:MAG: hypothetical protein RR400_01440 [Clostridia bacterium]